MVITAMQDNPHRHYVPMCSIITAMQDNPHSNRKSKIVNRKLRLCRRELNAGLC